MTLSFLNILSYLVSSGIGGTLVSIYNRYISNSDAKKLKAISAGVQIDSVARGLNTILNNSENANQRNWLPYESSIYSYLIYLNSWSEFVLNDLLDAKVMYKCAHGSLAYIDKLLLPMSSNSRIDRVCRQQIKHYQRAYYCLIGRYSK